MNFCTALKGYIESLEGGLFETDSRVGCLGGREGCSCVICQQARRTGKAWVGMVGPFSRSPSSQSLSLRPGAPSAARRFGPRGGSGGGAQPRVGKRAFLQALPHLPAGNRTTPVSLSACHCLASLPPPKTILCRTCEGMATAPHRRVVLPHTVLPLYTRPKTSLPHLRTFYSPYRKPWAKTSLGL